LGQTILREIFSLPSRSIAPVRPQIQEDLFQKAVTPSMPELRRERIRETNIVSLFGINQ